MCPTFSLRQRQNAIMDTVLVIGPIRTYNDREENELVALMCLPTTFAGLCIGCTSVRFCFGHWMACASGEALMTLRDFSLMKSTWAAIDGGSAVLKRRDDQTRWKRRRRVVDEEMGQIRRVYIGGAKRKRGGEASSVRRHAGLQPCVRQAVFIKKNMRL